MSRHALSLTPRSQCLLVASLGGHLAQLDLISKVLGVAHESHWVTFRGPQSESLMRSRQHTYVPYVGPRQWWRAAASLPTITRLIRSKVGRGGPVISTGSAIAVPALVVAALLGRRPIYIESISRVAGPSLSGRIVAKVPRIETYTQHEHWSTAKWKYAVSIFDVLAGADWGTQSSSDPGAKKLKIFVSLGTIRPYRFDSLVDAVLEATRDLDASLVWQLGVTSRSDLPGEMHEYLDGDAFRTQLESAHLVISHAGVGTCIAMAEAKCNAILVPRRAKRREHVDDHQVQISEEAHRRGLFTYLEVADLTERAVREAARRG